MVFNKNKIIFKNGLHCNSKVVKIVTANNKRVYRQLDFNWINLTSLLINVRGVYMSRKHGRAKRQKNKLQQLDYLSEDNVVIDFHSPSHNDSYHPSTPENPVPRTAAKTYTGKEQIARDVYGRQ